MIKLTKIEYKLRPYIIRFFPPKVSIFIYSAFRKVFFKKLAKKLNSPVYKPQKNISFCGLKFRNNLGNAAGFDKDGELLFLNYYLGAGFALVGTTLSSPHEGTLHKIFGKKLNVWIPLPHSNGAINSLGLPSLGIDKCLENIKKFKNKIQDSSFPIGISLSLHPKETEKKQLENLLNAVEKASKFVDFYEINESCPNIKEQKNYEHDSFERLSQLAKIKQKIKKPFFVKFNYINNKMIDFLEEKKFTGITFSNTQKDYKNFIPLIHSYDYKAFNYYTKRFQGGISGQIINSYIYKHIKLIKSYIEKKSYQLKLIYCGGIMTNKQKEVASSLAPISQWYGGLMNSLYTKNYSEIYK